MVDRQGGSWDEALVELDGLVRRGEIEAVANWCIDRGLAELAAHRRQLGPWGSAVVEEARAASINADDANVHELSYYCGSAAALVVVACARSAGGAAEALDGNGVFGRSLWDDQRVREAAVQTLGALRPRWLPALADRLTRNSWDQQWELGWALVTAGLSDKPTDPAYLEQMAMQIGPIAQSLRADPGLIDDVWRIFEGDGPGRFWSAGPASPDSEPAAYQRGWPVEDRYWSTALVTLSADGTIDRDDLIDRTLAALRRNDSWAVLQWFTLLLDELELSAAEHAARAAKFASLLAAPNPQVVGLAQPICGSMLQDGALRPDDVLPYADAPFFQPTKVVALAQLRILNSVGTDEAWRNEAAVCLGPALAHPRADVQEAALTVLERWWPDLSSPTQATLTDQAQGLAPSHLRRWQALTGANSSETGVPKNRETPTTSSSTIGTNDTAGWEPPASPEVPPPLDDDGFVLALAAMLEGTAQPMQVERALEAALQACRHPLEYRQQLVAPLAESSARRDPWTLGQLGRWAVACIESLAGQATQPIGPYEPATLMTDLLHETLQEIVSGASRPWTAMPDGGDGRIQPDGRQRSAEGGPSERLVRLLRSDHERTALRLSDVEWAPKPDHHAPIYTCSLDAELRGHTFDGGHDDLISYLSMPTTWSLRPQDIAWALTLTPHHLETALINTAVVICELCDNEPSMFRPPLLTLVLERLARPDQQPGDLAPLITALGLNAKPAATRLAAVDAVVSLIKTQRLTTTEISSSGARLGNELFKLERVARALQDLLGHDPAIARDLAIAVLTDCPKARGAHAIATILCDAQELAGPVPLPASLVELAAEKGRTKLHTELRRAIASASKSD